MKIDKKVLNDATIKFGVNLQLACAIEEMSELTKELTKSIRGRENRIEIVEEISDVLIVMEQLKLIFEIKDSEIDNVIDFKMNRFRERISNSVSDV